MVNGKTMSKSVLPCNKNRSPDSTTSTPGEPKWEYCIIKQYSHRTKTVLPKKTVPPFGINMVKTSTLEYAFYGSGVRFLQ